MTITSTEPARRPHRTLGARVALLTLLAASVAACGDDADQGTAEEAGSATPAPTPSAADPTTEPAGESGPACADVWVAGEQLPRSYRGCQDGDTWVKAFVYPCESGQRLVTFRRSFYAAKGGPVIETSGTLAKDKAFQQALAACTA